MATKAPNELTALEALQRIEAGTLTSETLMEACLQRIAERESVVGAWEYLAADEAMKSARHADQNVTNLLLQGIPFAVKDIFETADMPTAYGSSIYEGYQPPSDASSVALTRSAGGIVLGKTVTTEFAYFQPGKTANPHDPAHTPGGSSSGSAAAVADYMVPLAFGSQTVGSTIRPASYCGIVGYKPSYGLIDRKGIRPLADSFDTVGLFARDVRDVSYWAALLARRPTLCIGNSLDTPPTVGLCKTYEWHAADDDTVSALETAAHRISTAGGTVKELALPDSFSRLAEAQGLMADFEASRSAAYELSSHRDRLSDSFLKRIDVGLATTAADYDDALSVVVAARAGLEAVMDGLQVLLCPSAPGQAPKSLSATGDPIFNRMGTALRGPCLNIPGLRGNSGLPVGVQLIGRIDDDQMTLNVADWVHSILQ